MSKGKGMMRLVAAMTIAPLGAESAQELAEKLVPLYEAKAYNFEELARVQKKLSALLDELMADYQKRQEAMKNLASDLEDLQDAHNKLVDELKDAKSWPELGQAFAITVTKSLPKIDPKQLKALSDQFDNVQSAQDFAKALAMKFSLLASVHSGDQQRAYQKVADALTDVKADEADEQIFEALADYYNDKEVESSQLLKAHRNAAKALDD